MNAYLRFAIAILLVRLVSLLRPIAIFHTARAGNEIVRNSTVANAKICFAKFYVTYFVVLLPVSSYCTLIVIFHVRFLVLNHPTYIR